MVSIETRKRRSKRRQTMAELEAENTKLRQKIETLEKEMILIDAGKDFPLKPRSS